MSGGLFAARNRQDGANIPLEIYLENTAFRRQGDLFD
jgi:hypothetical protein